MVVIMKNKRKRLTRPQFAEEWQAAGSLVEFMRNTGYTHNAATNTAALIRAAGVDLRMFSKRRGGMLSDEQIKECRAVVEAHPVSNWSPNWKAIVYAYQTSSSAVQAAQALGMTVRSLNWTIQILRRAKVPLRTFRRRIHLDNALLKELGRYAKAVERKQ